MESLIEKLKQAGDESFETWFERWYKKKDIEHLLLISSSKGFNKFRLYLNNKDEYTRNRMLDKRFIPKMKKNVRYWNKCIFESSSKEKFAWFWN